MKSICIPFLCGVFCISLAARTANGQTPADATGSDRDLSKLSVEDLMNVQVTSASKKTQTLSRVAAAIFVITQEDIRRSGALNIPDLLRMVPGLDVAQINGNTWAISSRGFNGQFSNKLLVLIDGRELYTPTFAGVFWDTQDLPLENIDRIEVIRGPGGTVWGANAVNGVISIFTKKSADTKGVLIEGGGGTTAQEFGTVQYGGELKEGTQYRGYAKYFNNNHLPDTAGQNGADGWNLLSGGFRVDSALSAKDQLMVEGTMYTGREGQYESTLQQLTQANPTLYQDLTVSGGSIQGAWNHTHSDHTDSALQVSFSRYERGGFSPARNNTLDLGYQYHQALGRRHDIVAGAGYHYTHEEIRSSFAVSFSPPARGLTVLNAFVQDEFALIPDHLYLTAGTKVEHDDYAGFEVMPSVRLAWQKNDRNMFWAAASRSIRTPARSDTDATANLDSFPGPGGVPIVIRFMGNPRFQNEVLWAYEAGYRTTLGDTLSLDIAAFYNDYDHLQTTEPGTLFFEPTPLPVHLVEPLVNANLMHGETHGIELAANWKVTRRWTLSPGYAMERIHMHTSLTSHDLTTPIALENGSPNNSVQLRSHVELSRTFSWNASAYFVDRLENQGDRATAVVPSYTRMDTGVSWKITKDLTLIVVGQNLLQDHHVEFLGSFGSIQSSDMKRSAYAKFVWTSR